MKSFIKAFLITTIIGFCIYFISNNSLLKNTNKNENENNESQNNNEMVKYSFDISYAKKINSLEDIDAKVQEYFLILIGQKDNDATKKVSTLLGKSLDNEDLNIYYLEKDDNFNYQNLINKYADLTNYLNFTPVILAFKENNFIAGLPGEVEKNNINAFLEYVLSTN